MVQFWMSTSKEKPRLPNNSSPIPILIASVFHEPDEWCHTSTWSDHDDWNSRVIRKVKLVSPAGNNRNLKMYNVIKDENNLNVHV